jgi:hypothetical protein
MLPLATTTLVHDKIGLVIAACSRKGGPLVRRLPRVVSCATHQVFVYEKCAEAQALPPALAPCSVVSRLPNVGREAHAYLHHIVHHYDQLNELTVFVQDDEDGGIVSGIMTMTPQQRRAVGFYAPLRGPIKTALDDGPGSFFDGRRRKAFEPNPTTTDARVSAGLNKMWLESCAIQHLFDEGEGAGDGDGDGDDGAAANATSVTTPRWYGQCHDFPTTFRGVFAASRVRLRAVPAARWRRLLGYVARDALCREQAEGGTGRGNGGNGNATTAAGPAAATEGADYAWCANRAPRAHVMERLWSRLLCGPRCLGETPRCDNDRRPLPQTPAEKRGEDEGNAEGGRAQERGAADGGHGGADRGEGGEHAGQGGGEGEHTHSRGYGHSRGRGHSGHGLGHGRGGGEWNEGEGEGENTREREQGRDRERSEREQERASVSDTGEHAQTAVEKEKARGGWSVLPSRTGVGSAQAGGGGGGRVLQQATGERSFPTTTNANAIANTADVTQQPQLSAVEEGAWAVLQSGDLPGSVKLRHWASFKRTDCPPKRTQ